MGILTGMKFAEALALRADAAHRAEQLRTRIMASARRWDGERPAEDSRSLLGEAARVLRPVCPGLMSYCQTSTGHDHARDHEHNLCIDDHALYLVLLSRIAMLRTAMADQCSARRGRRPSWSRVWAMVR